MLCVVGRGVGTARTVLAPRYLLLRDRNATDGVDRPSLVNPAHRRPDGRPGRVRPASLYPCRYRCEIGRIAAVDGADGPHGRHGVLRVCVNCHGLLQIIADYRL